MGILLVLPVFGQDTGVAPAQPAATTAPEPQQGGAAPAPAPASAPAPAPPTWSVGPIQFSGAIDAYYGFNFNHPATQLNDLYNFNDLANQFNLSLVKLAMSHDPDPVGFRVDLGYGRTMDDIVASQPPGQSDFNKYVEQAYVSWKPKSGKGFEADFGKWVTSAGAEVIESYSNWNYSRSLAFVLGLPYYHFGLRTSMPFGSHVSAGFQVVNGWNNVTDNNSGKTVGFTGALTSSKANYNINIYYGPENNGTNVGKTSLVDNVITLTPTGMLSAYLNYDYGQNRALGPKATLPAAVWQAFAVAVKFSPTSKWSFTPRGEWFQDRQGFRTLSGVPTTVKEVTFTGEYKMIEGLLWRAEYRHDWSDQNIFDRGLQPGSHGKQDTLTLAFVAFFGPMR
jgi:hypothetical protein